MAKNTEMESIITKLEVNIKENGSRIKNKVMESCSMLIRTSMKDTG